MSYSFVNDYVDCNVEIEGQQLLVYGNVKMIGDYDYAEVIAANPPDCRMSYGGSGLPFPCANIAFEKTPNYKKITQETSGVFRVYFIYPNSYYTEDGFTRVLPSIFIVLRKNGQQPIFIRFELPMDKMYNVRTLTYRANPRKGPEYYNMKEEIVGITGSEDTMMKYMNAKLFNDLA